MYLLLLILSIIPQSSSDPCDCDKYFKQFTAKWNNGTLNYKSNTFDVNYWESTQYYEYMKEHCWLGLTKEELFSILGDVYLDITSKHFDLNRRYYMIDIDLEGYHNYYVKNLFVSSTLFFYFDDQDRVDHVGFYPPPNILK